MGGVQEPRGYNNIIIRSNSNDHDFTTFSIKPVISSHYIQKPHLGFFINGDIESSELMMGSVSTA